MEGNLEISNDQVKKTKKIKEKIFMFENKKKEQADTRHNSEPWHNNEPNPLQLRINYKYIDYIMKNTMFKLLNYKLNVYFKNIMFKLLN